MYDDTILFDWHNIYAHIRKKNETKYDQTISIPHAKPTFKALTSNLGASSSKSWRQRSWNPKSACRKNSRRPLDVGSQYDSRVSSSEFTVLFFRSNVMDWDSANSLKQDFAFFKSFTVYSLHSFIHYNYTSPSPRSFFRKQKKPTSRTSSSHQSPPSCFKSYHALPFYRLGRVPTSVQFAEAKRAREGLNLALYQWTLGSWWFFWGSPQIVVRQGEMPCCQRQKMIQQRVNRIGNTS